MFLKKFKAKIVPSSYTWWLMARTAFKVAVVGAGGGIGQPLSLLLRQVEGIDELALHDLRGTKGVAADTGHISEQGTVSGYVGNEQLVPALQGANLVVVTAGMPRVPGMTRDSLMQANGGIAITVTRAMACACPEALIAITTNPINIIVPTAAEVLKEAGVFNPRRLFGVTTLDVVRSRKFIGDYMNIDPEKVNIPVIGGHTGPTILPLFSQCQPEFRGDTEDIERLTHRIKEAGTEVVVAKGGAGSATLSMAYATCSFVKSLIRAHNGQEGIIECSFVASCMENVPFFAGPLELGKEGIKRYLELPDLNEFEQKSLDKLLPILKKNIEAGINFAKTFEKK
ncbi:malate dehydrogenase, mitochondrial [Drosophila miranda]|uniref:malate dehydrogenase, mitochondrial n=1 Tax=Drosophila miranda TaxID=7229 RepID=UPI0007E858FA|nr:malate dehydrogenase, mitochondrial [Drosophila miranda]